MDLSTWTEFARRHLNSLRPPAALDFSWKSLWPVPFYALACFTHQRARIISPRRLPTLTTTIKVPEIYATLALAHVAHNEADRLAKKMETTDWFRYIQGASKLAAPLYREHPEYFVLRDKEPTDLTEGLHITSPTTLKGFENMKYTERCTWTNEQTRQAASALLILKPGQYPSAYDHGLVTLFLAEKLKGDGLFRPAFLHDATLMVQVILTAALSMFMRSRRISPYLSGSGLQRTNVVLQRFFFYVLAFKWFAGDYFHYASILGLQDPILTSMTTYSAIFEMFTKHVKLVLSTMKSSTEVIGLDGASPGSDTAFEEYELNHTPTTHFD